MTERLQNIDHIGVAVTDLDEARKIFVDILGLEFIEEKTVPDRGVKIAFLETGNTKVELLEGIGENSPVSRFIEKNGPGIHHLCFEVEDISRVMKEIAAEGLQLIDKEPRTGAEGKMVAFLHPKSTSRVLIELIEK